MPPRFRLEYPAELPIAAAREEILAALAAHQVVVVCGATGSGKTTQLPKLCLEAGRGTAGMIGMTQPRRIAAQAVAARLAEELDVPLGAGVGVTVRFTDRTGPGTRVKVMTDGILLNEIRGDRLLRAYDTLIVDEAHERSLNIDFILGYLRRIQPQRPDLRIVITSATIEPARFARHFGGAPVIDVAGRGYPVEIRYRPRAADQDLAEAVAGAATDLAAEDAGRSDGRAREAGGHAIRDMLVFLPGERFIRDAAAELARRGPRGYEVLPLYARLTSARQRRILTPGRAPRIVLATNVAETSLTVPRIRYVIDSGLARVSRYAAKHRVQSLAVEPIARANAEQRAGRCGRVAPGVCVRLYAEDDFAARPEFPEPEIVRTGLAGVLLRLEALDLGAIEAFPFLDPPPVKAVNDAYQLLHVLGAVDAERRLTREGRELARLPVDPRVARLLAAANRSGALREALIVGAALSGIDPREQSGDDLEAARRRHEQFADPRSDFVTYLNLWEAYKTKRREGDAPLRKWCRQNYLSATRLREWHDIHTQLHELTQGLGWRTRGAKADYRALHQAVLAAFVDFIAQHEEGLTYRGLRDARAVLFPGTPLARKRPGWLVAAERIATERQYLRTVAQVNPRWVLAVAPQLVKREYHDPKWDPRRGCVTAREVVTLHGLTLAHERRVDYGRVAPDDARRIFVAEALAGDALGDPDARQPDALPQFVVRNRAARALLRGWEARTRRRDIDAGDARVALAYDERLPAGVRDRASLLDWCREPAHDAQLELDAAALATADLAALRADDYPTELAVAGQRLALDYVFEPGAERDGVTLVVPRAILVGVRREDLDWLVPGWLGDKVLALLKALPKDTRRQLVPLPDTVRDVLPRLAGCARAVPLADALRDALAAERRVELDATTFDEGPLPPYLTMRVSVVDEDGVELAAGRDLAVLRRATGVTVQQGAAAPPARRAPERVASAGEWHRADVTRWDFGELPDVITVRQRPRDLAFHPALVERGTQVDLTLLPPGPPAVEQHRLGVRRLGLKSLPQQTAVIRRDTLARRDLVLAFHGLGDGAALADDLTLAAADECFALSPPIRTAAAFEACVRAGRAELVPAAERLRDLLLEVLPLHRELRGGLAAATGAPRESVRAAISAQLDELFGPRFLSATPPRWRAELPRYLRAALQRLERAMQRPQADAKLEAEMAAAAAPLRRWQASQPPGWPWPEAVVEYRWLLEELRVSLFAQSLGTVRPVSAKRLEKAWAVTMVGRTGS